LRYANLLSVKESVPDVMASSTTATSQNQNNTVIDARGLTKRFGDFVAVDNVDLYVTSGEVFGLLGANGAGKTTSIRMLCGTLPPDGGTITVAGVDIVHHARLARAGIGYVSQHFALYKDLTVGENLDLAAGIYGLDPGHRDRRKAWALERLELKQDVNTMSGSLPLGYKQRLALAAALLHEPKVLFLDEPTSGIDPLARQRFWELIYDLADTGIGILVTTHYMDEALFCDRLSLMHAGRVVAEGSPEDLLERPLASAILDLRAPDCAHCAQIMESWPEVREIIPHAGHLRVRLQPGMDPTQAINRIRTEAAKENVVIDKVEPVAPQLEDVFVGILEEAGEEVRQ
jgi:ABC-2 type transport system ATP-binding protein